MLFLSMEAILQFCIWNYLLERNLSIKVQCMPQKAFGSGVLTLYALYICTLFEANIVLVASCII